MGMAITGSIVKCPHCSAVIKIPWTSKGEKVEDLPLQRIGKCSNCKTLIVVTVDLRAEATYADGRTARAGGEGPEGEKGPGDNND